jgi:acetyl-CoA carboxylase biotin carboxyl carrier protein
MDVSCSYTYVVMAEMENSDLDKIKKLVEIMEQNELVELEIKHGDEKIFLKRCPAQPTTPASTVLQSEYGPAPSGRGMIEMPVSKPQEQPNLVDIKSPIVGTFYATPSPDLEPYVEIGTHVEPQTVVCLIEAMKVMNEIKADSAGTIVEIVVTNGQAVEYGQVMFRVKPD